MTIEIEVQDKVVEVTPQENQASVEAKNITVLINEPTKGAVESVNGKTGEVVLTAEDVGALPSTTKIPSKTSDLTNDSGFLTAVPSEYVTESELTAKKYLTSVPSEYITEAELNAKGYLTQHQDLSSYAKKTELPTKTSQLTNDSGYLTAVPSEYVTETELTAKKYLTSVPSEYVTETELTAKGYAKQSDVDDLSEEIANISGIPYAVCSTAASTKAKVVNDVPNFELKEGAMIVVKFTASNSASSPTLNVNGTGAKAIRRYGSTAVSTGTTTTGWIAGAVQLFVYDGTAWVRDYWSNTTYSNASLGNGYGTCNTEEATVAKTATLSSYSLSTGGQVSVKFANAVPSDATLSINEDDVKAIYFRGQPITNGIIKAGDVATFVYSTYYHLIAIDRWQNDIDALAEAVADITVPTKVSQLTNDAQYVTKTVTDQLADEIAGLQQIEKPEIVTSVEQMTDPTKHYVLNGYIYQSREVQTPGGTVPNFTNQLPISKDANGNIYNGKGFKEDTYMSSGNEGTKAGYGVSGFIPIGVGSSSTASGEQVLRLENVEAGLEAYTRITAFDSSYTYRGVKTGAVLNNAPVTPYKVDSNNNLIEIDLTQFTRYYSPPVAFIRITAKGLDGDTIVTVNEEITYTTTQGGTKIEWVNTGLAYNATDYEARIIELESDVANLENRVDELSANEDGVFTYIVEEAQRVADIVKEKQTVGSLTFGVGSDAHIEVGNTNYWVADNQTSIRDAGLGLKEINKHVSLDFFAFLGDYSWADSSETAAQVKTDIDHVVSNFNQYLPHLPKKYLLGNHDINYGASSDRRLTADELYACVTNHNKGTVKDVANIDRNYGYVDYEDSRIRCIYLNTIDSLDYPDNVGSADNASSITAIQAQWLTSVGLNLTGKSNPAEWQIVLLSHHALDAFTPVMTILEAYKNGTNGSVSITTNGVATTVTYSFSGTSRGEIIANVHGHNHNYSAKKIGTQNWLWRVCIPNMCTTRNNEAATSDNTSWAELYGEFDSNGNPVYYEKTQGTATSTSFCIITIDRKNRKIHAIHYGAGIDRELAY